MTKSHFYKDKIAIKQSLVFECFTLLELLFNIFPVTHFEYMLAVWLQLQIGTDIRAASDASYCSENMSWLERRAQTNLWLTVRNG